MTDLPNGWVIAALGEMVANRDNQRVPVNAKDRSTRQGKVPYYGAAGQVGWIDSALYDEQLLLLGEDGVQFFDLGKTKAYIINGPSWVNNHAHVLGRITAGPSLPYLKYFLDQFDYHGYANGTTRLKLTRSAMDTVPVRLAPLAEQERIVTAIEEAFSKLGAGEAGLRTARQLLKRMREAVLAAAVTGRLVPQDPTDTPAAKLLADLGIETGSSDGLPDGWACARLGDIAHVGSGTTPKRGTSGYWAGGTVPWLTSGLITNGDIREAREFVTERAMQETSLRLWPPGTLLVAMYGEGQTRGRCAELAIEATCNQACAAISLAGGLLDYTRYVRLFFDANYSANRRLASGGVQPNLNGGLIKNMVLAIPPSAERTRIVAEVERQFSFVEACERAIDGGLVRSSALRRAVLKSAFEGRLVFQDPTDEPASVLLDRIRADVPPTRQRSRARAGIA